MAITRDDVLAALEQYLPRTANFSRSSDLGEYNRDEVFERIVNIILTSLLVDKDAVFFIIYLASQRLLRDIEAGLAAIEDLESVDGLKGISSTPPSRINTSALQDAQNALLNVSGSLAAGTFGVRQSTTFSTAVIDFLSSEIVPNVKDGGNNEKSSTAIRNSLEELASTWSSILERRDRLFQIVSEYQSVDLRVRVASTIITAIRQRITELQVSLPSLSTTEHGRQSEQILVDLSAADAALKIISNAQTPFGDVVSGPYGDGFTQAEYLVVEGVATIDPIRPILRGDDGKLFFDDVLVSTTGQTVTDGDSYTPTLSDPAVSDFTALVSVGQYLTLVDRGQRFRVVGVSTSQITLDGQTEHLLATPLRYVVTKTPPGTYFNSQGSSFWDEYTFGATSSTLVASGSLGSWGRVDKVSGSDGTNLKAAGSAAVLRPQKASGSSGTTTLTNDDFTDLSATFLTDGVLGGDQLVIVGGLAAGTYNVATLESETLLNIVGTFGASSGGNTWYIEDVDAEYYVDVGVDVFAEGVVVSDSVTITSGAQAGTYPIDEFVTSRIIKLTTSFTYEVGLSWQVRHGSTKFVSETGNFQSGGVVPGDIVAIDTVGVFVVASVDSQTELTLTTSPGSYFSGKTYAVYASSTETTLFSQADGVDFQALGVSGFVGGRRALVKVNGLDYPISQLGSASELFVSDPKTAGATGTQTIGISTFSDAAASFKTNGVQAGDQLYVTGTNASGNPYTVASVESETALTITSTWPVNSTSSWYISGTAPVDSGPLAWSVRAGNETNIFSDLVNSPFNSYAAGDVLVYRPGSVNERRVSILEVVNPSTVLLGGTLPQGQSGIPYAVIREFKNSLQLVLAGRRHDIVRVLDKRTLEVTPPVALTIGQDVNFVIVERNSTRNSYRLLDETGALSFGPAGFPTSIVGSDLEFLSGSPIRGKVIAIVDINDDSVYEAFDINATSKLGQSRIGYRLRSALPGSTDVFLAPHVDVSSSLDSDVLTVWELENPLKVQSASYVAPNSLVTVAGSLPARKSSQNFVIVRGGSRDYGRYVLYETLNSSVALASDTSDLRLSVAEVLIDYGSNTTPITSGTSADLSFDENGDGKTDIVTDTSATFITDGVSYGSRIDLVYPDFSVKKAYVIEVLSESSLRVDPALTVPDPFAVLPWSIVRSSVSNALEDSLTLRTNLESLRNVVSRYIVPQNRTVLEILNLLKKHRMDRAVDLLYDGKLIEFFDMASTDSSYSSRAKTSIQVIGGTTTPASEVSLGGNSGATTFSAGVDPATGKSSPSNTRTSATGGRPQNLSEVETRVALAKAVTDLAADERIRSMLQLSIDEARNNAVYELSGEIVSGVVSDQDPTLPWLSRTGSTRDKIEVRVQAAIAAIQYMIDNPEFFDDVSAETT